MTFKSDIFDDLPEDSQFLNSIFKAVEDYGFEINNFQMIEESGVITLLLYIYVGEIDTLEEINKQMIFIDSFNLRLKLIKMSTRGFVDEIKVYYEKERAVNNDEYDY